MLRIAHSGGKKSDPVAALNDGALLGVLTLADLARLPRENGMVPARFGIAAPPGTKQCYDPGKKMISLTAPNYIPYFADGRSWRCSQLRCAKPDAAFDLLAELGGPARSLEIVATPGLGAGPFRMAHLETDRLPIWYGYGLDAKQTKHLQTAMQQYVCQDVTTPAPWVARAGPAGSIGRR